MGAAHQWTTAAPLVVIEGGKDTADTPAPCTLTEQEVRVQVGSLMRTVRRREWDAESLSSVLEIPIVPIVWALAALQRDGMIQTTSPWRWRWSAY